MLVFLCDVGEAESISGSTCGLRSWSERTPKAPHSHATVSKCQSLLGGWLRLSVQRLAFFPQFALLGIVDVGNQTGIYICTL